MEDAMVINRGSLQRGFAHGQVYKPEIIDLKDVEKSAAQVGVYFCLFLGFLFEKAFDYTTIGPIFSTQSIRTCIAAISRCRRIALPRDVPTRK